MGKTTSIHYNFVQSFPENHLHIHNVLMRIVVVDLDFKKELELERQRQLIQKELSQLSQEEEARENITIQKKVSPPMPADVWSVVFMDYASSHQPLPFNIV